MESKSFAKRAWKMKREVSDKKILSDSIGQIKQSIALTLDIMRKNFTREFYEKHVNAMAV